MGRKCLVLVVRVGAFQLRLVGPHFAAGSHVVVLGPVEVIKVGKADLLEQSLNVVSG